MDSWRIAGTKITEGGYNACAIPDIKDVLSLFQSNFAIL
jgi:hypothetical protein